MEVEAAKRRVWFSKEDDLEMMRVVVSENPFKYHGRWDHICQVLTERRGKHFAIKTARQRVNKLVDRFREKDMKDQLTSGKEERWDQMELLLQEASDLKVEVDINPHLVEKRSKRKLADEGKATREEAAVLLLVSPEQIECEPPIPDDDSQSPLDSDTAASPSSLVATPSAKPAPPETPDKKRKGGPDSTEKLVGPSDAYIKRPETEEYILAKGWARKFQKLSPDQRRFAEKIINDTLFEAEMGTLTREGVRIVSNSLDSFGK